MKLEELNPFVRYAAFHTYYEETKENRVCYDCRLFYILSGEGVLCANGDNYNFSNNALIYLPPRTKYRFLFKNPGIAKIYLFDFDLCDSFSYLSSSLKTPLESAFDVRKSPQYELLPELSAILVKDSMTSVFADVASCVESFLSKEPCYIAKVSAKIKLCLVRLMLENNNAKPKDTLINSVKEFIKSHYMDAELNNSAIAEYFNYHSYYLNRLIKDRTGITLHDHLLFYRIEMAKNLLVTTDSSISTVADKTGFSSYSYFINRFRHETGMSPRQYRMAYRNKDF